MGDSIQLLSDELAMLGLDLESTLREEPRFLLDARFLGALHVELADQLGPKDARAALLQMGFLHGLRDALRVLRDGFSNAPTLLSAPGPSAARLAMRVHPDPDVPLRFVGRWPEVHEAEAVRAVSGRCPDPTCHVSVGYTSGWLSGILEMDVLAVERRCAATDAGGCEFEVREIGAWPEDDAASVRNRVALPTAALRHVVLQHLANEAPAYGSEEAFEPGAPVVHVWGPVMVIPFAGPDESMRALELIGRDPAAREVRVVIIDLTGAIVDDGFGAAALEQILDAIETWGAEPVLAGVSPLSESVVAGLEATRLVVHKDLPKAIAAGFQIADAQRVLS